MTRSGSLGQSASLRIPGPVETIDRALFLARGLAPRTLLRAWLAASALMVVVLSLYVIERVEGVRSLRPLLAALLVGAYFLRVHLLMAVAREVADTLGLRMSARVVPRDVMRTATWVAFGVLIWTWPLAGLAKLSPFAALAAAPLLCLRGTVAPSWLARAALAEGGGLSAYRAAVRDTDAARGTFLAVELLSVLGALALFVNLFAVMGFALLIGHAFFGLDVSFTSAFLSPDNGFVLLVVGAATFVLLEPLRVAISTLAYAFAITRRDGGDLDSAIDDVVASHQARARGISGALLAWTLVCASAWSTPSQAQIATDDAAPLDARDAKVRERVQRILQRDEFIELADTDRSEISDVIERWMRELAKLFEEQESKAEPESPFALPSPDPWTVLAVGLALGLIVAAIVYARRDRSVATDDATDGDATQVIDPSSAPAQWLDDAQRLAAGGDFHGALRALYVATIVSLDRRGLIRFEPATTNWQYSRQLPRGELRGAFSDFTRVFDHKHYGKQATTADEYVACRSLAERLCRQESST